MCKIPMGVKGPAFLPLFLLDVNSKQIICLENKWQSASHPLQKLKNSYQINFSIRLQLDFISSYKASGIQKSTLP